ncbi:MAG: hypothetical protein IBJ10_03050 [Phycisphaerales bacterium]|nr:hypothetical protein [Phycisphaerales bacterium]
MNHSIRGGVGSIRWGALLFSVPYTLLWARALVNDGRDASAILLVVAHGAALLWGLAWSDKVDVSRSISPRAGALQRWTLLGADPIAPAVAILGFFAITPALALLAVDWRAGAAVGAMLVGLALFATSRRSRKFSMAEALLPLIILVAPALVLGEGPRWSAPEGESPASELFGAAVYGATFLGAVALGLIVLFAALRDRVRDLADGLATTATRAGERGASFVAALWLSAVVALASMGCGWGWWSWAVPAAAGLGAAWCAGAMARADWRAAAIRAAMSHAPLAAALALTAA